MQVRLQLYCNLLQDSLPHLQLPDSLHFVQQLVVLSAWPAIPILSLRHQCLWKVVLTCQTVTAFAVSSSHQDQPFQAVNTLTQLLRHHRQSCPELQQGGDQLGPPGQQCEYHVMYTMHTTWQGSCQSEYFIHYHHAAPHLLLHPPSSHYVDHPPH